MLQSFSRAYLEAIDQAHLGMSDTVAGNLRSRRWGDTPSMKRHGHPFPVTGDALKGACFLPILGWCHHDDSHFLRALGTKQRPGVSKDCPVRHMMLHGHDEFLPVGQNVANDRDRSDGRVASVYNCSLARAFERQISGTRVSRKPQHDHPNERRGKKRSPESNLMVAMRWTAITPSGSA